MACPICMDAIVAGVTGETRTSCGHSFHFQCLVVWMSVGTHKTCPVCRAEPSEKERIVLEGPMHAVDSDDEIVVARSLIMLGELDVAYSLQRHRR
jgi:hypothetical protein